MRNVILFRIASIGDTVVALPALKLAARAFHDANRVMLTNFPGKEEAPVKSVVENMGIAHDYIEYPTATRDTRTLWNLRREIVGLRAEAVVYLTPRDSAIQVLRDIAF